MTPVTESTVLIIERQILKACARSRPLDRPGGAGERCQINPVDTAGQHEGNIVGRVSGKVAFITGAARGQGRSHAVRLAEEGADIIAVDLCETSTPSATRWPLRRISRRPRAWSRRPASASSPHKADVREAGQLRDALDAGLNELGKVDIVVAQAGIAAMKGQPPLQAWTDGINTNFVGTINAIQVALPHLEEGASIIATASAAALMDAHNKPNPGGDPGGMGYMVSKRLISEYVHYLATELAVRGIRANVIHPTNCNTDMLQSQPMYQSFRPDLEKPTQADAEPVFYVQQAMKVPWVEPQDISNAVLWLASDESRFVTGMQLRVDAGGYLKWYDYHI